MELTPELTPFLFGIYKLVKYALYPLSWVLLLMSLTTVLLLLPMTPRRLRWARIGSTGGLILLFVISSPVKSGATGPAIPRFAFSFVAMFPPQ